MVIIYLYWRRYGISTISKTTKICVFQYSQTRTPKMALNYISSLLKKRPVSLIIFYSGHISHFSGYRVVRFDCAGVLMS